MCAANFNAIVFSNHNDSTKLKTNYLLEKCILTLN